MSDTPQPKPTKRVLVIEDEKPLANALELKFRKQGWEVTVANDGQTGVSLILNNPYDVVLLDLMMPIMNGFQVLDKLQGHGKLPVFLVLSNLTQPEDAKRAMELGARKFLVKSETPLATIVDEINKL